MISKEIQILFQEALKAGSIRDYEKALKILLEILASSEDIPEALLFLGRCYHAQGKPERAIAALRSYISKRPEDPDGYFFLGRTYLTLDLFFEASRVLYKCIVLKPEHSLALGLLGYAMLKRKKPNHAVVYLEKAISLSPDNKRLYKAYIHALFVKGVRHLSRGEFDLARQHFTFTIENGLESGYQYLYRASALRDLEEYAKAADDYETAKTFYPDDPAIPWQKAVCLLAMGETAQAMNEIEELRLAGFNIPEITWNLDAAKRYGAIEAYHRADFKTAISEAISILKKDGKDSAMHSIAAESFFRLGQYEKSRNHWERAIESERNNPDMHYGLVRVLFEIEDWNAVDHELKVLSHAGYDEKVIDYYRTLSDSKRRSASPEDLVPRFQKLIRDFGPDVLLMEGLALAYFHEGRPDLAEGWFIKIIAIEPDHEYAMICLIAVYEAISNKKKLSKSYETYLSKYPDNLSILKECADFLYSDGKYANAVIYLEKMLLYTAERKKTQHMIATCYRNTGKFREAALIYRELIRESPKNSDLVRALAFCLEKLGKVDLSLQILTKASKFIKNNVDLILCIGIYNASLGRIEEAIDSFRKASDIAPDDPRPYKNIGVVYERQGMHSIAQQYFTQSQLIEKKIMKKPNGRNQ